MVKRKMAKRKKANKSRKSKLIRATRSKKSKKSKKSKNIKVLVIVLAILIFLLFFISELFSIEQEPVVLATNMSIEQKDGIFFESILYRYPTEVLVIERTNQTKLDLGVSSETDRLNFGRLVFNVTPVVTKFLSIPNNGERPAKIKIINYGNISQFITPDQNNIIVQPGKELTVKIVLNITELGYYTGEMEVKIKIPKYDFLIPALYFS